MKTIPEMNEQEYKDAVKSNRKNERRISTYEC